jgi:hypothetical protein
MGGPGKTEPLMPKWLAAKKESDALSKDASFKPDMVPAVKKYDLAAADYDKWTKEKEKLPEMLKSLTDQMDKMGEAEDKLDEQRTKVKEEDDAKFAACNEKLEAHKSDPDADPAQVIANLDDYLKAGTDFVTVTKSLNDQISKTSTQILDVLKKGRDAYKAKADAIAAGLKKAEADGKAAEGQIRTIGLGYEKIAVAKKDMDTVGVVRAFLNEL